MCIDIFREPPPKQKGQIWYLIDYIVHSLAVCNRGLRVVVVVVACGCGCCGYGFLVVVVALWFAVSVVVVARGCGFLVVAGFLVVTVLWLPCGSSCGCWFSCGCLVVAGSLVVTGYGLLLWLWLLWLCGCSCGCGCGFFKPAFETFQSVVACNRSGCGYGFVILISALHLMWLRLRGCSQLSTSNKFG